MPHDAPIPLPNAAKLLGLTPEAVRQRVKRGEIEGFRDNRGRWQVVLGESDQRGLAGGLATVDQAAALRAELATWQERADGLGKRLADRDRELAEVKAERDRLLAIVERFAAERRPWPGMVAWWRRFWRGEGP